MNNQDLAVTLQDTFDSWRSKYNILLERSSPINDIGELSALNEEIPLESKNNLVSALNYVYQIRVSEGQPLTNSTFTNCLVPLGSSMFFGGSGAYGIGSSAGKLRFSFGDSNLLTVLSDGSVGVGTELPTSKLHVVGETKSTEFIAVNPVNSKFIQLRNLDIGSINYSTVDVDTNLLINNSSSPTIINRGGGKVGIGYSSVEDFSGSNSVLNVKSSSSFNGLKLETLNTSMEYRLNFEGISLYQANSKMLQITNSGNFGFGVDNPTYKLQVNGNSFANEVFFGSKLHAGSSEIVTVTGSVVTFVVPLSGSLKYGSTTIIDTDGKIIGSTIKGLTSTDIPEGTNQYFTDARARTAVSGGTISNITVSSSGTIVHGSTTIVGTDSKIPVSVVKDLTTTNVSEGTNLYFTDARARTAVASGALSSVSVSGTGTIVHGSTTIVGNDSKIPASVVKDLSTTGISEGTNLYFTDARARTAVAGGSIATLSVTGTGTIVHGSTTIVGTDSKIPVSVVKDLTTTNVSEGTNLYHTTTRVINAVSQNDIPGITLSDVLDLKGYATTSLPSTGVVQGSVAFDSTLVLPVFYDGSVWKKFDGTPV